MTRTPQQEALARAVAIAGSQAKLAQAIHVSQPTVFHWLRNERGVPGDYVPSIEKATGVPRHELRPDLWDPAPSPWNSPGPGW